MKKMLLLSVVACFAAGATQAQPKPAAAKAPAKPATNVQSAKQAPAAVKAPVKAKKVTVKPTAQAPVAATQPAAVQPAPEKVCKKLPRGYELFQIGLWFDQPTDTKYTDVYGIKIGAPICSGDGSVNGIETAVFCGATREVNGLSACILWSDVKEMNGIQFSIINIAKKSSGLQLSVMNFAEESAFQIGILNYNKTGFLPWFPVINFSVK